MQPPIRPQLSSIKLSIRYFTLTVMHHTYQSQGHAAALGGGYYLSSLAKDPKKYPNLPPPANGPIHTECRVLKHVVASAAEAEFRGLFHNGQIAVPLRITLHELNLPNHQCSEKLHLQSYLEMLGSETGCFGLLGNNNIFVIILLDLIER